MQPSTQMCWANLFVVPQVRSGSASSQGQENGEGTSLEDEDTIQLLDEGESPEVVQYDPTVKDSKKWNSGETINKFLEKHFAGTLEDEELDQIMEDFLIPDCPALCTPQVGKDPHFGTEKALYNVQN